MIKLTKSLASLGIAMGLTGMSGGAFAADVVKAPSAAPSAPSYFSDTEIQAVWGDNFDLRSNSPGKTSVATLSFEHFSTWKYGDNFFLTDAAFDLNGTGDDAGVSAYSEFYSSFSLSKITGANFSYGPVRDVSATIGLNVDGDGFLAMLYGGKLDLNVPGFNYVNLQAFVYDPMLDVSNRNLDTTYQFTAAWQMPIVVSSRVKLVFQGFVDLIGNQGQGVKTQLLTQPQLRLDLGALAGGQENKYFIGTEVSYWKNKFGTNTEEFAPQIIGVFKF